MELSTTGKVIVEIEELAQSIKLDKIVAGESAHGCSAAIADLDTAVGFEQAQSLASALRPAPRTG